MYVAVALATGLSPQQPETDTVPLCIFINGFQHKHKPYTSKLALQPSLWVSESPSRGSAEAAF